MDVRRVFSRTRRCASRSRPRVAQMRTEIEMAIEGVIVGGVLAIMGAVVGQAIGQSIARKTAWYRDAAELLRRMLVNCSDLKYSALSALGATKDVESFGSSQEEPDAANRKQVFSIAAGLFQRRNRARRRRALLDAELEADSFLVEVTFGEIGSELCRALAGMRLSHLSCFDATTKTEALALSLETALAQVRKATGPLLKRVTYAPMDRDLVESPDPIRTTE